MAFDIKNLGVFAYSHGCTLWRYATPDPTTAIENSGYFSDAADLLNEGDRIMASTGSHRGVDYVVMRKRDAAVCRLYATPGTY